MTLLELHPEWLADPGRSRMGLRLDCPRHPWAPERAVAWFENPGDGGEPKSGSHVLVTLLGDEDEDFGSLTLVASGGYPPDCCIQLGHWFGWLADGQLTESLFSGVAW